MLPVGFRIRSTAAGICLLRNTVPVAFGPSAHHHHSRAAVTGLPIQALSPMVGRLCATISVFILPICCS